jgi:hypothetical protein
MVGSESATGDSERKLPTEIAPARSFPDQGVFSIFDRHGIARRV